MAELTPKVIADFTTQLSTAISIGGTTFSLASILDDDGNSIPSGKYCFTIDNGSSDKEYLMGDMVAGVVSNVVSVTRQGVESSGAVRAHRIGASVILTDFVVIQRVADILRGILTLNGSSPLAYDTAPTLSSGLQVATVAYVLSVVTGGTVNFDNQIISGIAGETLAQPNIAYFKESDQRWWLGDVDVSTTYNGLKKGVARSSANAGAAVSIQLSGIASGFTGLTPGAKLYLSGTAGGVTETAPQNAIFIGWAITSTTVLLAFEARGALLGTQGIPSENNPFVTADNTSAATTNQTQTTQNATIEVGEADATTKKNLIAQSFIPTKTKIRGVKLYKAAHSGTPAGTLKVALQADTSGSPSGSDLASVTLTNAQVLQLTNGEFDAIFGTEYSALVTGALYWIVISCSTSDTTNHPNLGTNSAGGYGNGSVKYKNTTDGWVAVATIDLYFKTLDGTISQIPKSGTDGFVKGLRKKPTVTVFDTAASELGGSTTQFDITNPSGTTFRYTYDGTGTDPNITSATIPVGSIVAIRAQNFNSNNNGIFIVTASGTNYFEVTNASGVAETNKTIGTGFISYSGTTFYTKSDNLSFIEAEIQGGGAAGGNSTGDDHDSGGGGGGYTKKYLNASDIIQRIAVLVAGPAAVGSEQIGRDSAIALGTTLIYATGGNPPSSADIGGTGGSSSGGDIAIPGGYGGNGSGNTSTEQVGGQGGDSVLGFGGAGGSEDNGSNGTNYGGGGGGASDTSTSRSGGAGAKGCVIFKEEF